MAQDSTKQLFIDVNVHRIELYLAMAADLVKERAKTKSRMPCTDGSGLRDKPS